jgi:hypothetical protein
LTVLIISGLIGIVVFMLMVAIGFTITENPDMEDIL